MNVSIGPTPGARGIRLFALTCVVAGQLATGVATRAEEPAVLTPGTQFTFRGSVGEVKRDRPQSPAAGKTFDLTLLVVETDKNGIDMDWLVDERGHGAWPWLERYGRLALDTEQNPIGPQGPALLYDYGAGKHPIPLVAPLFAAQTDQPLAADVKWQQNDWRYEIDGTKEIAGRPSWQIVMENNFGPKRTFWLDKESPLVLGYQERVFMDKGTEYLLEAKLVGIEHLDDANFRKARAGFDAMIALRARLKRPARSPSDEITPEQRAVLAAELPKLEQSITSGGLSQLVRTAARELDVQRGRAAALARLNDKHVGQAVEKFALSGLGGEQYTEADLGDKVTVLHFWDYRDEPLKEPYGQVGYLEFLHNRRKADGLRVYGVAVDSRLEQEKARKAAMASVRKLKSFMNLTYPVLLDDGSLLKQFDDPRTLGAQLPLVIVVGPDGKVVHYHVGFYAIDRQDGLKELDAIVAELLSPPSEQAAPTN